MSLVDIMAETCPEEKAPIEFNLNHSALSPWLCDQILGDLEYPDSVCFVANPRIASAVQEVMDHTPNSRPCVFSAEIPVDKMLVRDAVTGKLLARIINLPTPSELPKS